MKPHGTRTRYARGCHCRRCREANAEYAAEQRARKADAMGRPRRQNGRPPAHDDVIDVILEVLAGP